MTRPTKEHVLNTLDDLEKVFDEGLTVHGRDMFETVRTYINGDKDSLGADEEKRLTEPAKPDCRGTGFLRDGSACECYKTEPASAHVPRKVRELLEHIANGCLVPPDGGSPNLQDYMDTAKEAIAILDQQDAQKSVSADYARGYIEGVKNQKERFDALCEKYGAQSPLADLRAEVIGLTKQEDRITTYPSVAQIHNAALDAVLALIDDQCSPQEK